MRYTNNSAQRLSALEQFHERISSGKPVEYSYSALLGLRTFDSDKLLQRIRSGFSYHAWTALLRNTSLDMQSLATLAGISSRTLSRRKAEGKLAPDESDRLLRAARIFALTLGLFEGDIDAARIWLLSPQLALGGELPVDVAATEFGAREVEDLIGRIEHGIPV